MEVEIMTVDNVRILQKDEKLFKGTYNLSMKEYLLNVTSVTIKQPQKTYLKKHIESVHSVMIYNCKQCDYK